MEILWTEDAADEMRELSSSSPDRWQAIRSELPVMFADGVPYSARLARQDGAQLVRLPCGAEITFDDHPLGVDDGIFVLSIC